MNKFILYFLFILPISSIAQSPLCQSFPTSFCCEYVSSVSINGQSYQGSTGFSSSSGGNPPGYFDYTGGTAVPTITAGQQINISYTAVTNGNYMEYFKLWIDFNGNGILTDPGELVHQSNTSWSGTRTFNFSFTVPTTVFNGVVYMRFIMQFSGNPTICGSYPYGNTFDFKTNIIGAQPNPNNPDPTEKIKGNVSLPMGIQIPPKLKLVRIEGINEIAVDSTVVGNSGEFSLQPDKYNSTYKIIPTFLYTLDTLDFINVFLEAQNIFSPDQMPIGQYLSTGPSLKASDMDEDGRIDINDAYLVLSHITGLRSTNRIYWYEYSQYITMDSLNFNQVPEFDFILNFGTSDIILDLSFICAGDSDLSFSSN